MCADELNEIAAVRKISRLACGSSDLKEFLWNALGEIMHALAYDAAFFHMKTTQEKSLRFLSKGFSKKTASLLVSAPEESFTKKKSGMLADILLKDGLNSFALHPIRAENSIVGHLGLARKHVKNSKPGDSFNICLEIIGIALAKARLREQSDKLHGELVALQGINKITTQGFNIDDIIQEIVVHGKRLVKSSNCYLFLVDDLREYLYGMASTRTDAFDMNSIRFRISEMPDIVMGAAQKRCGIAVENLEDYAWRDKFEETARWHSIIFAPLLTQDQITGALICSDETDIRRFTENEVLRVEMLARQASIALENARLFEAVSRSQKSWETTFDAMQDCVSVHDTSGKIIRANAALARRLRTTPRAVIGRYCSEIYNPSYDDQKCCRHARRGKPKNVVTEEIELPSMNGFFQLSISPWYDKNNQIAGFVHIAKDISNEKLLQQQLIQSEKLSAIGELISGIAHELNNPLTGVMGYSQLLQMRKDIDDRAKESLSKINSLAVRCQKIVQNLLSFARKKKPERILSDINEILYKTLELRNYDMQVNNIELISEMEPGLPGTIADVHQLQQVFLNIITNAEQAMLSARGQGRLVIRTRSNQRKGYITVEFIDNGPGIPEKYHMRIFDPFFTTKEVGSGTGLGLSLSYGIIKEHGGDIFVRKHPGKKGAHFVIEIPIITVNDNGSVKLQGLGSLPDKQRLDSEERVKRILMVDDEKYILDFLVEVFRLLPFTVDTATDSRTALNKIQSCDYDLVITDYRMPHISGGDLFNWVRENRPSMVNKIVFMTGDTVSPKTYSFFKDNSIRYLTKPFKIEEIKDIVAQTLGITDDK